MRKGASSSGSLRTHALLVFAVALAIRLWHTLALYQTPWFEVRIGDALGYDEWARTIAEGDWLGSDVFYQAPLYPYFLGAVYSVFGYGLVAVRVVQAVLGASACVLLMLAGRRVFSPRAGLIAGLLLALYAPAIFFDSHIQKSALDGFFLSLLLWLVAVALDKPRARVWFGIGATTGLLALTRENALLLAFPLALWLFAQNRRTLARPAAGFALGVALVLLPVALRNQFVGGEFHLTTSQLGPNLYIGNNPDANGTYRPMRPERQGFAYERRDATELAEAELGRALTPGEVSSFWTGRVVDYIRDDPGDWLALMWTKFELMWNAAELADTEDQYTYADESPPLRWTGYVFHFGTLVPLALLGVWVTFERRREFWILYLLPVVYGLSVVAFFVFARYRFPLVPFLVLFAAPGITQARAYWRVASGARRAALLASLAVVALFCNRTVRPIAPMRAATRTNLGLALGVEGRFDEAIEQHEEALRIVPGYAKAHNNLAMLLHTEGDLDAAAEHYRAALESDPAFYRAHNNYGALLQARGLHAEARVHYERALAIEPDYDEAHNNYGSLLLELGRVDEARTHFTRAVELEPAYARAHMNLGLTLQRSGDVKGAIEHLSAAVELEPDQPRVHAWLASALVSVGSLDSARAHYADALRFEGDGRGLGRALRRESVDFLLAAAEMRPLTPDERGLVEAASNRSR